jgi:hypothetical protein
MQHHDNANWAAFKKRKKHSSVSVGNPDNSVAQNQTPSAPTPSLQQHNKMAASLTGGHVEKKSSGSGLENRLTTVRDPPR